MANITPPTKQVNVALAVVRDAAGQLLVGRREDQLHQGGLLEFPGGKIEAAESAADAMVRELEEETGLVAQTFRPLITVPHFYPASIDHPALRVVLHVFLVSQWQQPAAVPAITGWHWELLNSLQVKDFPQANIAIFSALRLPEELMITAALGGDRHRLWSSIRDAIATGVRLVCLRDPGLSGQQYQQVASDLIAEFKSETCQLLVNCDPSLAVVDEADGLHLSSSRLSALSSRPIAADCWLSASCHNLAELEQAAAVGVDFVTLSPVQPTTSHPQAESLGWSRFTELVRQAVMPVFALGGVSRQDRSLAQQAGAQGVAGIRLFQ